MSTGYNLKRLTVKNTTPDNVQAILRAILIKEGSTKDRAIAAAARYMDNGEREYDECFDSDDFECMEPSKMDLRGAMVEVSYG